MNERGKAKYTKIMTTSGTKAVIKAVNGAKIKKGTYYRFIISAVNASGNVVSISKVVHVATPGGKFTNVKSISTASAKVTLKAKKTFKLKAKTTNENSSLKAKNHRKLSYLQTRRSLP